MAGIDFGFTLLELLVVLLIIGVMTSFVVLSIGGRTVTDEMRNEAARLQQLFVMAQDEALYKRVELGFYNTEEGYGFLTPGAEGEWVPYTDSGPLRARRYPEPVRGVLFVEGQPVPPPEQPRPAVLILSSGDMTPFRLELRGPEVEPVVIQGDTLGRVRRAEASERR